MQKKLLLFVFLLGTVYAQRGEVPHCGYQPTADDFSKYNTQLKRLMDEGVVDLNNRLPILQYQWPLQPVASFTDYNYFYQGAMVDNDTTAGILDYNCGDWTYDGHYGSDYYLWPFPWEKFDLGQINVIAAADGVILNIEDTCDDRICPGDCINGAGNYVVLVHADGNATMYMHLKRNTVVNKNIGDSVYLGEIIGKVGTSGASDWPHLHFGMYDTDTTIAEYGFDSYWGPCNLTGTSTAWASQLPYLHPGVNSIRTHSQHPKPGTFCPPTLAYDTTYYSDNFNFGDSIYFYTYFRHVSYNDQAILTIRRPDNSVFTTWNMDHTAMDTVWIKVDSAVYVIPSTEPSGTWTFEADYKSTIYTHQFNVGGVGIESYYLASIINVYPNPFAEQINVSISDLDEEVDLTLMNTLGEVMLKRKLTTQNHTIDMTGLSVGVYYIRFGLKEGELTRKIIKTR